MEQLLVVVGKYMNDQGVFTFGELQDEAFIDQLPENHNGVGILLTDIGSQTQQLTFDNKTASYEKRTVGFYVTQITTKEARDVTYNIYNQLKSIASIDNGVQAIRPHSPIYLGQTSNQLCEYLIEMDCLFFPGQVN